jgi:hypothetical protein
MLLVVCASNVVTQFPRKPGSQCPPILSTDGWLDLAQDCLGIPNLPAAKAENLASGTTNSARSDARHPPQIKGQDVPFALHLPALKFSAIRV